MSGGTTATTNYPASILGGLWTDANQSFPATPYGSNNAAAGNAFSMISGPQGLLSNGVSQYGYNPYTASTGVNGLNSTASGLGGLGQSAYGTLSGAGNNIYGTTSGAGNSIYGTTSGAGNSLLGGYLGGAGQNIQQDQSASNQALTNAFDPQKALFNQQFQQQQQQNLASQAQAGVATTPYGAGLTEQGDQNFDIAWQQAQLANQAQGANTAATLQGAAANQGLQGAEGLYGTGVSALSGLYGTGANALSSLYGTGESGLSSLLGAGSNTLSQGAGTAINQSQYAANLDQSQITDYLNYLSGSSGNSAQYINALAQLYNASTGQYSAANSAQAAQAGINAQGLSGIGQGLGLLGGIGLGSIL